ncbi:ETEC_3214 domain-containing protein [Streptomyces sp. NRRL S-1022]|uniref:ETEC_3214 domain-containing protein n=1 Tax=Streptomyces sp. NRRL S-1022 TaxID=1463880 RepID=UPI0004C150F8|nr:ETEC_3214 domain-containing protein [Streptomyces sp. NRRL S-1022]
MTEGERGPTQEEKPTFGERFKKLTERNLPLVGLLYVSSVVTAVSTFITAFVTGGRWYQQHFQWQAGEYAKLAKLHAGYTLQKFEEQLGRPSVQVSIGKTESGDLTQNTFQPRKEYWVDAVTDPDKRVVAYAVTSCSSDFNPSFTYWDGERTRTVSLNRTPFSSVLSSVLDAGTVKAFYSPTFAPHYYYGIRPGDVATVNRAYAWGLTNLCSWKAVKPTHDSAAWSKWFDSEMQRFTTGGYILVMPAKKVDKVGRDLMSEYAVNTYAETAPAVEFDVYPDQIGVNPMLIPPGLSQLPWAGPPTESTSRTSGRTGRRRRAVPVSPPVAVRPSRG